MSIGSSLSPLLTILIKNQEIFYRALLGVISFFTKDRHQGTYEILDYETTLELNQSGATTHFFKRQKVRFLQDNILSFQDYLWGDGEIFANYQCSPGIVVDKYRVGDRWHILISLRESKSKGDVEEFLIQARFDDSYRLHKEWQQIELRHHTKRLKTNIIFPKKRHCKDAVIQLRRQHRSIKLDHSNFGVLPDGRQLLTWNDTNIHPLEVITIHWTW
jgi:hypothetical protein